jgi:hypothetical protein
MNWVKIVLIGLCLNWQGIAFADGDANLIPELNDIEKIANDQEKAIRAQSDALLKAQKEKEVAEKAAEKATAALAPKEPEVTVAPAPEKVAPAEKEAVKKPAVKKVTPPAKVDPWLAQERRYTFP